MNKPSAGRLARFNLAAAFLFFSTLILSPNALAAPYREGLVLREVWTNVAGTLGLPPLTNRADFPLQPALVTYETSFEAPNQFGDNFGQRLSGLLRPRITGNYVFYISSDDQGELYLSTDATSERRRLIAVEPQWSPPRTWVGDGFGRPNAENRSLPIPLEAGKTYYLEALHREGGGGDNLGVTWRLADEEEPANGSPPISGEFFVGVLSPPVLAPAAGDQDRASVASDGNGFFVVWQDRRNYGYAGATDYDIYGSRVSASGEVLDRNGLRVCVKEARQENPSVVFDGSNYLVVWEEHLDNNAGSSILARRVTRQGQLLDGPNGFLVSQGNWLETNPRVAWNGTTCLAVWIDWRHHSESISDIYGARITPAGAVLDPAGIKIHQAPLWQTWPVVAAREGKFFVVWSDMNSLKATFVDGNGTVANPSGLKIAEIEGEGQPAVSSGPNGFLVTWHETRLLQSEPPVYDSAVIAQQVRPNGELLAPTLRLSGPDHNANHSAIAAFGSLFRVVWANQGASSYQIETVVTPTTMMPVPVNAGIQPRSWPSIAYNGTKFLVAWTDRRHVPPGMSLFGEGDIYAVLLGDAPLDPNGFLVSSSLKSLPVVTWPSPADIVYGTKLGAAQLNATASVPGTFSYNPPVGVLLPAGQGQTLTAVFTPSNPDTYGQVTATTTITVKPAPLTIRADNKTRSYGVTNPPLTASYVGLVNDETPSSLDTPPQLSTAATINTPPGIYPIQVTGAKDANYAITHVNGSLTILPATTNGSWAQDPSFDPSLQQTLTGLEGRFGWVSSISLQTDGKAIIGGRFIGVHGHPVRNIARLHPSGTPDLSFRPSSGPDDWVNVVAAQPDGAVLLGGVFQKVNGAQRPFLARLKPDGTLDHGFTPQLDGVVHFIEQQRDGRILIGGEFRNVDGQPRLQVARLQTNGRLDPSFVPDPLTSPSGWNPVQGLALTSDEKVLVARAACDARDALRRLNPDGTTDAGFLFRQAAIQCGGVMNLSLLPDGRIFAVGSFGELSDRRPRRLIRLLPDGALDTSFEQASLKIGVQRILARPEGKVIVGGHPAAWPPEFPDGIGRLNADGSIDTSFVVPPSVLGQQGGVQAIVARPDGRLLIGRTIGAETEVSRKAVAQLQSNGAIDPSFELQLNSPGAAVNAILPLEDGRCLLGGGFYYHNNTPREALVRLNHSGTLDAAFSVPRGFSSVQALTRQPDGKILAGGALLVLNSAGIIHPVARLHPNGALDATFNAQLPSEGAVYALALQADGKVLVGGDFRLGDNGPACLARLLPDGRIDPTFVQGSGITGEDRIVRALAVQPDGRILVGGYFEKYNGVSREGLIRLMPNGNLDASFPVDVEIWDVPKITVLPGGKVLFLGNGKLVRLLANGTRDLEFNPPQFEGVYLQEFATLPDGRIIVSGQRDIQPGPDRELIAILDPNGRLEANVPWDMIGWHYVETMAAASSTEILVGGYFEEVNGVPCYSIGRIARAGINPPASFTRTLPDPRTGTVVAISATPGRQAQTYAVEDQPPTGWGVRDISHNGAWDPLNRKVKFGPFFDHESRTLTYQAVPHPDSLGVFNFEGQGSVDGVTVPIVGDSSWVIPSFHPADGSPSDWRMNIDEMTAYAAAWRNGITNSLYPEAIPMSYVTRAAALWRGGEFYRYDPNAGYPPLCWVNSNDLVLAFKADAEPQSRVFRRAPEAVLPGNAAEVTIEVTPHSRTLGYAVEERVPPGWTPRAITHSGVYLASARVIRWGPFLDAASRCLSYEIAPGPGTRGALQLCGTGSFDGRDCAVEGQGTIRDGSGLAWRPGTHHSGPSLELRGWQGDVWFVESSTDLQTWSLVNAITNHTPAVDIPLSPQTDAQRFYRARRLER